MLRKLRLRQKKWFSYKKKHVYMYIYIGLYENRTFLLTVLKQLEKNL